jgi:hypothetical protein
MNVNKAAVAGRNCLLLIEARFMPLTAYAPVGDPDLNHRRHRESRRFSPDLPAGEYVYVQDVFGDVYVLRQEHQPGHAHHVVLGRARSAVSAGELILGAGGVVLEINNISGTFQCAADSLFAAIGGLVRQGAIFNSDTQIREFSS